VHDNPYMHLPDKAFWRRSVAQIPAADIDPVGVFNLKISPESKVATAGSCFAQHIARHLVTSGFNYHVTERGHPILPVTVRTEHNYGQFSARYGNIYTALQLLQLFHRAYGTFEPQEEFWIEADGSVLDPFRPSIQPGGFISIAEAKADRHQHFAAVREMFETMDVFVFTLGLTECWRSRADGAVFAVCPGTQGGCFDPQKYVFFNQQPKHIAADMTEFFQRLREVNPKCQVVLTVSPVPLVATAEPGAHALSATTYSKSVLRAAAELLRQRNDFVHYFPSYEIISGPQSRGRYFADDLRNVTEEGVSHVMRTFLKHAAGVVATGKKSRGRAAVKSSSGDEFARLAEEIIQVECDELALDV
jgi:hypothetical protein